MCCHDCSPVCICLQCRTGDIVIRCTVLQVLLAWCVTAVMRSVSLTRLKVLGQIATFRDCVCVAFDTMQLSCFALPQDVSGFLQGSVVIIYNWLQRETLSPHTWVTDYMDDLHLPVNFVGLSTKDRRYISPIKEVCCPYLTHSSGMQC